jgi:predicted HicB family RNase H-like nuclease
MSTAKSNGSHPPKSIRKIHPFPLRIGQDLRTPLQQAANRAERSLQQEIIKRLKESLQATDDQQ